MNTIRNATPQKFKTFLQNKKKKLSENKDKSTAKLFNLGKSSAAKAIEALHKSQEISKKKKAAAKAFVKKAKETDYRKIDYTKIFWAGLALFSPILLKAKKFFLGLKAGTVLTIVATSTIGGLTGIEVYKAATKDENKIEAKREVAHVVEEEKKIDRPDYYNLTKKQFQLEEVKMPVYIEKSTSMKALNIDFTFESSNRYIKAYFQPEDENGKEMFWLSKKYLIRNKINSSVEPIIPEFPLEDEGKRIIRKKVKDDVNQLLKELGIKGRIEKVLIKSILAG